jgi:flagellar basal-body rod protein FlgB
MEIPTVALSLIDGLKARMQWLQARQSLVSSNIANANSPGFRPLDLTAFTLEASGRSLSIAQTNEAHLSLPSTVEGSERGQGTLFETKPSGNAVSLEDEMTKLADIQLDYQMATQLYTKSLGLLKIAIGRK